MAVRATTTHVPTRREHILGSTFAVLVAIIWVLSAELVQQVFNDSSYDKPYFVTYYSLSAFLLCLLGFVKRSWRDKISMPPAVIRDSEPRYQQLQNAGSPPAPPGITRSQFTVDEMPHALHSAPDGGIEDGAHLSAHTHVPKFNVRQVVYVALTIAPIFFIADWVFTVGLDMTSVASSSTISTLSALFTLAVGSCMGVEEFSYPKLFASFMTIAGVALITAYDGKLMGQISVIGDMVNVLSAFIYALYTACLKRQSGRPGSLDVAMLFGFIGLVISVGAIPGLFALDMIGFEKFEVPSGKVVGMLTLNALIGTVLSDYLWAKSIVLTTPLIGTLALSLTVPLSVIFDYFFKSVKFTWLYLFGVGLVLLGFFIVNFDEAKARGKKAAADGRPELESDAC